MGRFGTRWCLALKYQRQKGAAPHQRQLKWDQIHPQRTEIVRFLALHTLSEGFSDTKPWQFSMFHILHHDQLLLALAFISLFVTKFQCTLKHGILDYFQSNWASPKFFKFIGTNKKAEKLERKDTKNCPPAKCGCIRVPDQILLFT